MKKSISIAMLAVVFALAMALAGCSGGAASSSSASADASSAATSASAAASDASASASAASSAAADQALENGVYTADFDTDSSMFHVNEASDGKGTLTVSDDGMTIHVSLVSKKIVNVYAGTAAEAEADEAGVIEPTVDEVTYSDGATEEVYGFDIPVPALDEEFDVAILGEKGTWYDHKVSISNPEPAVAEK